MYKYEKRYKFAIIILILLLIVLVIFSFGKGRYDITVKDIFLSLYKKARGIKIEDKTIDAVLFNVRLPRIMFAILVGAALSISGACYQGVFKNPLVSSNVIGASSGAAFGAAIAILFGMESASVSLFAFLWALIAVILVYLIGNRFRVDPLLGLVLTGIMISSIFKSGLSFIKLVSDPMDQLPQITYWLMGSLASTETKDILPTFLIMIIASIPIFFSRWNLNLLTLEDEEVITMGVNVKRLRMIILLSATLLTASSIAVSGMIGWVSLAIPHFARLIVGNDYRKLIPVSAVFGSVFLLIVDNISRLSFSAEIPLGIITSLIGAPFFLLLLYREGRDKNASS